MKKSLKIAKQSQANTHDRLPVRCRRALETLLLIDLPAKGRIAHHIRTGRPHRALELCEAGKLYIWKRLTPDTAALHRQKILWSQLQQLLRSEASPLAF